MERIGETARDIKNVSVENYIDVGAMDVVELYKLAASYVLGKPLEKPADLAALFTKSGGQISHGVKFTKEGGRLELTRGDTVVFLEISNSDRKATITTHKPPQ